MREAEDLIGLHYASQRDHKQVKKIVLDVRYDYKNNNLLKSRQATPSMYLKSRMQSGQRRH